MIMTTTASQRIEDELNTIPEHETRAQMRERLDRQADAIKKLLAARKAVEPIEHRAREAEARASRLVTELRRLSRESAAPELAAVCRNFRAAIRNRSGDYIGSARQRESFAALDRQAQEALEKFEAVWHFPE